jgi:UDP-N-acetylglucosamine:LPS N-acetylglucosamine transferase
MAGTIVADTIQDGAGNSTSMDNAIYGSAKAWVVWYNASSTTVVINGSYNVSSVTANSAGDFTVNMTKAMPNANYVVCGSGGTSTTGQAAFTTPAPAFPNTTSTFRVQLLYANGGLVTTLGYAQCAVFSS